MRDTGIIGSIVGNEDLGGFRMWPYRPAGPDMVSREQKKEF